MKSFASGVFGLIVGLVLWSKSLALTGAGQPWAAATALYPGCLFVAGALLASIEPRRFWSGPLGLYLGQGLALASQAVAGTLGEPAVLLPLAPLFLLSYSLPCFVGAALTGAAFAWRPGAADR